MRFEVGELFDDATALELFIERPSTRIFAAVRKQIKTTMGDTGEFGALSDTDSDKPLITPGSEILGVLLAQVGHSKQFGQDVSRLFGLSYQTNDPALATLVSTGLVGAWQERLQFERWALLRVNVPFRRREESFWMMQGFMRHRKGGAPTRRMVWPMDY